MRLRVVLLDSITDEGFADKSANVDGMASLIAFWTPGSTTETVEIEEAYLPSCPSDIPRTVN